MTDVLCAIDSRPVGDNAYICQSCTTRLERSLGDVRWLDQQLDIVLMRQTASTPSWEPRAGKSASTAEAVEPGDEPTSGTNEVTLPYDDRASEARFVLVNTITTWARVIEEEASATQPTIGGIGILAAWIGSYTGWLRHHAAAEEAWDELGSAITSARRLIDTRPERFYAGPCGGLDGVECGQDLYAKVGASDITCPGCRARYDAVARREWLIEAAHDHLATAREVSALLHAMLGDDVNQGMIRGYVRRGRLASHGTRVERGKSVALYRIGDVIGVATAARYDAREQRATKKAGRVA